MWRAGGPGVRGRRRRRHDHPLRRLRPSGRCAARDDPGPRHGLPGLGAPAPRLRPPLPLHHDRQPGRRPDRSRTRALLARAHGRRRRRRPRRRADRPGPRDGRLDGRRDHPDHRGPPPRPHPVPDPGLHRVPPPRVAPRAARRVGRRRRGRGHGRPRRRGPAVARRPSPAAPVRDLAEPDRPGGAPAAAGALHRPGAQRSSTRRTSCVTSCTPSGSRCSSSPAPRTP